MTAAEIFAQAELDIFAALGVPVTYTPVLGTPIVGIMALISSSLNLQPSGLGSETWAPRITVELRLADLSGSEPAPGDTVLDGSVTYTLAAPLESNGQIVKWVVE